jgi:uncharacterized membrane protein YeaQ/YmgE (transglycosylase-associated protein family)
MLSFVAWIMLGVATGYVATRLVRTKSIDVPGYLGLGAIGAVVGGWRFNTMGLNLIRGFSTGINLYSLVVAVAGAAALLFAYYLLFHSMLERSKDNMH